MVSENRMPTFPAFVRSTGINRPPFQLIFY
jgi:hypothetical protein